MGSKSRTWAVALADAAQGAKDVVHYSATEQSADNAFESAWCECADRRFDAKVDTRRRTVEFSNGGMVQYKTTATRKPKRGTEGT